MAEIMELRTRFGGDRNAINKHSVRYYEVPGVGFFLLDRTLDGCPPFFQLLRLQHDPRQEPARGYFPASVHVRGLEYWGDGLSWKAAEILAKEAMAQPELTQLRAD